MPHPVRVVALTLVAFVASAGMSTAGVSTSAIREASEVILRKFGKGTAGETVDQIASGTARAIARHGDESLPLLRAAGHSGFRALEEAGEQAPDLLRLYARHGDEALWIITDPKKLATALKYGDPAVDALLKHPGLADDLITRFGVEGAESLTHLSRGPAQRLSMLAADGTLDAMPRKGELLGVIRRYGDEGMNFIWKNKGALAVAAVLATFLDDPEVYISGAKELVADPILKPIAERANWNKILLLGLAFVGLPVLVWSIKRSLAIATSARAG